MDWMLRTRTVDHDAIESTMLKCLARKQSLKDLVEATISKLEELKLVNVVQETKYSDNQILQQARVREDREFHRKMLDVAWELVAQGIITLGAFRVRPKPGADWVHELHYEPSAIGVTAYGERCIQARV
jgi:hypothetical protein